MTNPVPANQAKNSSETPRGNDASSWLEVFTPGRLAGLIALFLFALYPGVVIGTDSFFFRDYGLFSYPLAYFARDSFWHGQIPLWNPLNNCGVPFLAQWNTAVCYPLSIIFLVFPLPQSLNYFGLGHLILAGVGMYWLVYHWTQNRLAASVAGLVFALNGLMLNSLMWVSTLAALSWQPWVVLWIERAWRTGGRQLVIAALIGAMQMLAGTPEIIVFTWVIAGALWLARVCRKQIPFGLSLRRFTLVVGLIVGLAAIQLLPFLDFLSHSERSSAYSEASSAPMPPWGWANLVVPLFRCLRTIFGDCLQTNQPWTASYYLGIGTLALAVLAVQRRWRQTEIWSLTGLTLAGLVLALGDGGYVYTWLKHILPWIGFARYPVKFVSIAVFTIPLLAAYGLVALQSASPGNEKRNERPLLLITSFLVLTAILILAAARWLPSPGYDWRWVWPDGVLRVIFLIVLTGAVCALYRVPPSRLRRFVGFGILALVGFDLLTAGTYVNPVVVTKAFGPLELNMVSRPKFGESRAMLGCQIKSDLLIAVTKNPLYYFVGLRGALFEDCNIPENIPKVDGFYPLHLKNEWEVDGLLYGNFHNELTTNAPPAPLLDFLGVSQVSASNSIFVWQARSTFLPLVTAGQRPVFADDAETMKQLQSANFDPRHTVYLPLSARNGIETTNACEVKIRSQQFRAQQIHLAVEAAAPALVVIAQSFYHNWHADVDGHPVPLLRANHAFQAVEVPAGEHEITLRYVDWMFRLGAMISALTLLGCVAGLFVNRERRNPNP